MNILEQIKAKDRMVDIISVTPEATVLDTIDAMLGKNSNGILVVDDGNLKGIVSDFDLIKWLKEGKIKSVHIKISDIMTEEVIYAHPDDELKQIVNLMFERSSRFIPIVLDNKPLGVITRKEIGKIFAKHYGHRYKARDLMTYRYATFSLNDSLETFFRKMGGYDDKYSIIISDGDVVGVITPINILKHLRQKRTIDIKTDVKDLMTENPYVAKPGDRCDKIANIMVNRNLSGVPIVDKHLEGLIRYSCFLQFMEK
ncbi:MAG: CBS domain-containing protein [Candidatus Altiarchaeota archaeon]